MATQAQAKIGPRGNAQAVTLSKEVLAAAGLQTGDSVHIEASPAGIQIRKLDDAYADAMTAGEECFNRYARTLHDLAR
jgi:antitoxin component of MazEF toxin-antitoxin module